jgi:hypothetical protein
MSDGFNLAPALSPRQMAENWRSRTDEGQALRGAVLIVHGLGEHGGRYERVAERLNDWGFAVRAYDQFGHGESEGPRGTAHRQRPLLADGRPGGAHPRPVAPRRAADPAGPQHGRPGGGALCGDHPAGGRRWCSRRPRWTRGSTRCRSCCWRCCRALCRTCAWATGWMPTFLSHDPAVVQAYLADPLVHDRISGAAGPVHRRRPGPEVVARAPRLEGARPC